MRLMKVLTLVAIVALAAPLANAAGSKHKISLFTGYAMPNGDLTESETIAEPSTFGAIVYTATVEADDGMGFGLGYEYRFSDRMSFAGSLSSWSHDIKAKLVDEGGATVFDGKIGDTSWMPLLFDLNFHFLDKLDLYVGPTVGYAFWDDLKSDDGGDAKLKDAFTYGVNVGLDVPLGEKWAISGGLRYVILDAEPDAPDAEKLGVDPLIVTVGLGYRF